MEGTASEITVFHCEHRQMEVILSHTRDISIDILFVPIIHGTNGLNVIVVKFNKVVLILKLLNVYHLDSVMLFNY